MIKRIFISSVQSEFSAERLALVDYFRNDPLLSMFFQVFIFEEIPALNAAPNLVYPEEVKASDIYLGLVGKEYGYEDGTPRKALLLKWDLIHEAQTKFSERLAKKLKP